jgi:hypothetical protein
MNLISPPNVFGFDQQSFIAALLKVLVPGGT